MVGRPVMVPVAALMDSPAGRPVADQLRVAVGDVSVAALGSVVTVGPESLDWAPGLVTETVLVIVQVKLAEPAKPAPSVAVRVTG